MLLKYIFLLLVTTLAQSPVHQEPDTKVNPERNMVISTTGLNIREKPDRKSKRVAVIPFGHRVTVLDTISYGVDTVGTHRFYDWEGKIYDVQLHGRWVKVSYKGVEGYVIDGFLTVPPVESENMRTYGKYALQYAGTTCFENQPLDSRYTWWGVYDTPAGYELRKVELSYFVFAIEEFEGMLEHSVSAGDNKDLRFLLGSTEQVFKEGILPVERHQWVSYQWTEWESAPELFWKTHRIKLIRNQGETLLELHREGRKQIINKGLHMEEPYSISWTGDLDGDGKEDYIIGGGEKSIHIVLFLSSEARGQEIVRPVAVYYNGFCC